MVDWYLWWVDDRMMWGRLCAWMTESVSTIGWEAVTLRNLKYDNWLGEG